jgi:hypothetical protein
MAQLMRGLGSLAVLLLGLAVCSDSSGSPRWQSATTRAVVERSAACAGHTVDGAVLVGLIAIIGWLAWMVFRGVGDQRAGGDCFPATDSYFPAWTRCTATIRGRPTDFGDHDDLVCRRPFRPIRLPNASLPS